MKKNITLILSLFAAVGTLFACTPAPVQEQEQEDDPTENTGEDDPTGKTTLIRNQEKMTPTNPGKSPGRRHCRRLCLPVPVSR